MECYFITTTSIPEGTITTPTQYATRNRALPINTRYNLYTKVGTPDTLKISEF